MGAPKGNQYAVGNEGGRPPIHTDPKEVNNLVKDYFEWIQGDTIDTGKEDEDGNPIMKWIRRPENPTVTGLALHLGFSSKDTLYQYAEKEEFSDYIKRGLLRIEKFHEMRVSYGDKCVGNIFVLKNFRWKDTQAIDHSTMGKPLSNTMKVQVIKPIDAD